MDAFVFSSPIRQCLPAKLPPFLTTDYVGRYGPVLKDLKAALTLNDPKILLHSVLHFVLHLHISFKM